MSQDIKLCPECHHRPSMRNAEYGASCQCRCHDVADLGPELLSACTDAARELTRMMEDAESAGDIPASRAYGRLAKDLFAAVARANGEAAKSK